MQFDAQLASKGLEAAAAADPTPSFSTTAVSKVAASVAKVGSGVGREVEISWGGLMR